VAIVGGYQRASQESDEVREAKVIKSVCDTFAINYQIPRSEERREFLPQITLLREGKSRSGDDVERRWGKGEISFQAIWQRKL
jgi:hypothetical protein